MRRPPLIMVGEQLFGSSLDGDIAGEVSSPSSGSVPKHRLAHGRSLTRVPPFFLFALVVPHVSFAFFSVNPHELTILCSSPPPHCDTWRYLLVRVKLGSACPRESPYLISGILSRFRSFSSMRTALPWIWTLPGLPIRCRMNHFLPLQLYTFFLFHLSSQCPSARYDPSVAAVFPPLTDPPPLTSSPQYRI